METVDDNETGLVYDYAQNMFVAKTIVSDKSRVTVNTLVLDDYSMKVYDTGLMRISHIESTSTLFQMTNTESLNTSGYLSKLLKVASAGLSMTHSDNFEYNYGLAAYKITVDFNEESSGETVRGILDDSDLTDAAKFATVISLLKICPKLPIEQVLEIAHSQRSPEEVKFFQKGRLKGFIESRWSQFLLPTFTADTIFAEFVESRKLSPERFIELVQRLSLMSKNSKHYNYGEMLSKTSGVFFNPIEGLYTKEMMAVSDATRDIECVIDSNLHVLNAEQLKTFLRLYNHSAKELLPTLVKRISDDVQMTIDHKDYRKLMSSGWYHMSSLCKYLSIDEITDFFTKMMNSKVFARFSGVGDFGASVFAFYYLEKGFESVEALTTYMREHPEYANVFFIANGKILQNRRRKRARRKFRDSSSNDPTSSTSSESNESPKEIEVSHFLKVFNEEYCEYPIEWSLSIILAGSDN